MMIYAVVQWPQHSRCGPAPLAITVSKRARLGEPSRAALLGSWSGHQRRGTNKVCGVTSSSSRWDDYTFATFTTERTQRSQILCNKRRDMPLHWLVRAFNTWIELYNLGLGSLLNVSEVWTVFHEADFTRNTVSDGDRLLVGTVAG